MNKRVYTVGQVNRYIRGLFAGDPMLAAVFVRGEVSNVKYHTSGHIYFSLKDATGAIPCVMFASSRRGLAFRMKDGDKVIAGGSIDVYERDGRYQLYAREIRLEGAGELYERYQALKKKLEAEGCFRAEIKKKIPKYAATVGVVTAPTGAAIRDIQTISRRRNPYVQVILCPAQVQGEGASESIVRGIQTLDGLVDVLIVGRGGGSLEDLWAFNEENVARAICACMTPVISAVGHETDVTIADFAADLRAATPSAAAEIAVFDYAEFSSLVKRTQLALDRALSTKAEALRKEEKWYEARLKAMSPERKLRDARMRSASIEDAMRGMLAERIRTKRTHAEKIRMRLAPPLERRLVLYQRQADEVSRALPQQLKTVLRTSRHRLALMAARMEGISPAGRLRQGYAYAENRAGHAVRSVKQVGRGDTLTIYVSDGRIITEVKENLPDE